MYIRMTALLFVFTALSLSSFFVILAGSDPYSAGTAVRVLFFTTLSLSLTGVFSIVGILSSKFRGKSAAFEVTFRRAALLSALVVGLILLETLSLLNIYNAVAVSLLVVGLEMFSTYKKLKSNEEF